MRYTLKHLYRISTIKPAYLGLAGISLKDMLKNKRIPLILSLSVTLGFFLRLYHLGNQSLWCDELGTYYWVHYSIGKMLEKLSHSAFPPLYYLLMKRWIFVFGNTEFALRFP